MVNEQSKIDTAISDEFRQMLLVIAEQITEFHGDIPLHINKAYKEYAVSGDINALEEVRRYLYNETGTLELSIKVI